MNYWFHVNFLTVDGKKMSKSLNNFYTLEDLEKKGFDPLSYRLMVLDSHYKNKLNFTIEGLKRYEKTLNDVDIAIKSLKVIPILQEKDEKIDDFLKKFEKSINDDLDTHSALKVFFGLIEKINEHVREWKISGINRRKIEEAIDKMNFVLQIVENYSIPKEIGDAAEKRAELRKKKEWEAADALREEVKNKGFDIIDIHDKYIITKHRKFGASV